MKSLIAILSCAFLLLSCCKKKEDKGLERINPHQRAYYFGTVTASRNGISWQALPVCSADQFSGQKDSAFVEFDRYENMGGDSVLVEALLFGNIAKRSYSSSVEYAVGDSSYKYSYSKKGPYTKYGQRYGGDELTPPYTIIQNEPHTLTVTAYNPANQELTGTFAISFLGFYGDIVRFTDGEFHIRLIPERMQ